MARVDLKQMVLDLAAVAQENLDKGVLDLVLGLEDQDL